MNQYVPTVSQKIVSIILPPEGMVLSFLHWRCSIPFLALPFYFKAKMVEPTPITSHDVQ
jgi:hypothetical protein